MKAAKLLLGFLFVGTLMTSCYTEVFLEDEFIEESGFNTAQVLQSFDLWYIDIHATKGNGEVPFLERAFTISFDNGRVYANNNMVGLGKTGNGYGIEVGYFDAFPGAIEIDHDVDGLWLLDVFAVNGNTLELYDSNSNTSYFLKGYQLNRFDFDLVFYDNIHYFLQEYDAWEKTYTSDAGALNDFDKENYLQFNSGSGGDFFRSSIDLTGTSVNNLQWDFEGDYTVYDVENDETLKTLTLEYDFMGNDYFELYVINDSTIELYHPSSGTVYRFKGRGYIQYLKSGKGSVDKKRRKASNPVMQVKRSRVL
ncbi:MAG: nicotinic acid mononucleotide adenyltransferase [Maribacter sp.]|uniref:nicotinic acid mononucleotide adenyltransferase n=1 Tax=Maribacter sp. TaxID=1897614 RepID=UPI003C7723AA